MGNPPSSTYRLQLGPGMTFGDATTLADYLADLGAGALYASPMLVASPGTTHGYDVVDPTRISDVLGGEPARKALSGRLRELGLGLVADIVPNHMGVAVPTANPWWWDVLRHGRESRFASYFDIDWARGPILLPVLEDGPDPLADLELRDGQLHYHKLTFPVGDGHLHYHKLTFPVADGTDGGSAQQVHERQHYRLVPGSRGAADLTYRRFFDVSGLAALRVEDPEVFAASHAEVLRWVSAGEVCGLRVDHPDGLTDPREYLHRLRTAAPQVWLLVEKILQVDEALPASWPVDGTTGYDALREICGVFVDPAGAAPLTALYAELAKVPHAAAGDVKAVELAGKHLVAATIVRADVRRVAQLIDPQHAHRAEAAIAEILCAFDVYRSYLPEGQEVMRHAIEAATDARPDLAAVIADTADLVLADPSCELAIRLQQTAPMVMAKGVEDTAFYRYNRFIALNEVGGAPDRFGVDVTEFHAKAAARDAGWPATMTTLSTHDTKRSEDVRARLATLSEVPEDFALNVHRWSARCCVHEPTLNLLAWQTLVAAWPIEPERLRDYLRKASKEAKLRTTWTDPDPAFDATVSDWPFQVMDDRALCAEIASFVSRLRVPGRSNSLGQKLLQLAGPGVPDVYQGTELWDNSLVDPDNRRPVDFVLRRRLLREIDGGWLPPLDDDTGAAKLLLVATVLRLRRARPELFRGYRPLWASGPAAEHAVAFARGAGSPLVAVVTRLPIGLETAGGWRDTFLPLPAGPGSWTDVLTNEPVKAPFPQLAEVLDRYPVALLVRN